MPVGGALRFVWVLGADGLLGTLVGALAGLALAPSRRLRASGAGASLAAVMALVAFPALAAALGLFANRVLLRGTHFLSRVSLAADVASVLAAAAIAFLGGRALRHALRSRALAAPSSATTALAFAPLLAALLIPALLVPRGAPNPARPSIILVSIDTLRPDRLSTGGDPRGSSPELDRLVREGLLFSEALTVSPGSAGGHAALLTSRYPVSNGVYANFCVLDSSVTTLAEVFRARGYRTGAFVTNTFLGRRFGFDQGFDTFVESGVVERLTEPSPAAFFRSLSLVQIVDRARERLQPGYDPSFETALRWIRESRRPAFFFVHLMDVHSPYAPPPPFGPRFHADPDAGQPRRAHRNLFGWRPSEPAYVAEVRFADTKIGRLRRALQERSLLDDGVMILTSDHGENLLDHEPNFSHGKTLYDATLRILAAVRAPATALRRGIEPAVFENVDVLPTLAALLGMPARSDWEGRAFHPSAPPVREPTFAQLERDFAARTSRWKLVMRAGGARDYYRLDEDPGESRAVSLLPEEEARIAADFASWLDAHATPLYLEHARSIPAAELPSDVRDKLRALGYVQ
ncbi:MAG: sulfatase [bacterium]